MGHIVLNILDITLISKNKNSLCLQEACVMIDTASS